MRWLFVIIALSLAAPVHADDELAQARKHYQRGTAHYNLEEYAQSIQEFEEAYRIHPDPAILYNIAQAYRLMKNPERALHFYRAYLRELSRAPNRAEVEQHIAEMERLAAAQSPKPPSEKPATVKPPAAPQPKPAATQPKPAVAAHSEPAPTLTAAQSQPSPAVSLTQAPAEKPRSRAWIAGVVAGVIAVGLAVGLGVGYGLPKDNPPPNATYPNMKIF
jgi:tetratricopeptide (TPR) repeat protein